MRLRQGLLGSLALIGLTGCGDGSSEPAGDAGPGDVVVPFDGNVTPRAAGERAPRSGRCDGADTARCLLPWPSNTFTVRDPGTATGLRVQVDPMEVAAGDTAEGLNRSDGFSRLSPVLTAWPAALDPASLGDGTTGAVQLVVATPGEHLGERVPLRIVAVAPETPEAPVGAVVAYPRVPLRPATDYVAVVTDALRAQSGTVARDAWAESALGLRAPRSREEAEVAAYHAPSRAALAAAQIMPTRVLRMWEFTTGSADGPRRALTSMRTQMLRALASGRVTAEFTRVTVNETGPVHVAVLGRLRGLPRFTRANNTIARDAMGNVLAVEGQTFDALFRVIIPRGTGDYRFVMYGHGTGGTVNDSAFDAPIAGAGASKVGVQFDSLTETEVLDTLANFARMELGVEQVSSRLMQSAAGAHAILYAMLGVGEDNMPLPMAANLREQLAGAMLGGTVNPAAGRRPMQDRVAWTGGSLGGTMGFTIARSEPRYEGAVLNVPGAAWTHYLTFASLYRVARPVLERVYRDDVGIYNAVAMSQALWDEVDGAAWADGPVARRTFLLQQSMGDPVLPGPGTEFAASSLGAVQLGQVLTPIEGVSAATGTQTRTTVTQFRVPTTVTGPYDIHGFADRNSPAGLAAREQIEAYLRSVWAGAPEVTLPSRCVMNTPANSCDFSAPR